MSTKEIQGKLWSVAPHYWSKHFEPYFLPLYKKTLEQVHIDKNTMLLDAGCGAGLFSNIVIASGAEVIGVDAAAGLLEVARERNPQNNFMEEDLESLPFAAGSFDVVAGFNSFQYAGNFSNALSEAKRVLKENGKLVIGIWDKPELSEATNILKAIGALLPPPPPGAPSPFALSEDGKIESICTSIGLTVISKTKVACPMLYNNMDEAIKSFLGTGPAAAALNQVSSSVVEQTIAKAMKPYRLTEDMYHLQNSFLLFVVEKK
ncbi:MAG: class I SAM-dependent methyltransferase [Ferruginibacter sp.]